MFFGDHYRMYLIVSHFLYALSVHIKCHHVLNVDILEKVDTWCGSVGFSYECVSLSMKQ